MHIVANALERKLPQPIIIIIIVIIIRAKTATALAWHYTLQYSYPVTVRQVALSGLG